MGRSVEQFLAEHGNDLVEHGDELADDELAHYGKLGMRWGKRNKRNSEDSGPAKPSVKDMTDDELRTAIARLRMEKDFASLTAREVNAGKKIVGSILLDIGKSLAKEYVTSQANQRIYGHPGGLKAALAVAEAAAKNGGAAKAAPAVARTVMQLNKNHGL